MSGLSEAKGERRLLGEVMLTLVLTDVHMLFVNWRSSSEQWHQQVQGKRQSNHDDFQELQT